MKAEAFSKSGNKAVAVNLPKDVFDQTEVNADLLKTAYIKYMANHRTAHAKALTRSEVSGGGRKPWRQKGTGRARFGSSRNPIWRHGGVAHGPKGKENFSINLTKKSNSKSIAGALSLQAKDGNVVILETFECKAGKVKDTINLLNKMGLNEVNNILLVVSVRDELVDRATQNIPGLVAVQTNQLSVFEILNADKILIDKKALENIKKWLGTSK